MRRCVAAWMFLAPAAWYLFAMKTTRLLSSDIFQPGASVHFTRAVLSKKPIRAVHDHDYYEVFWLHHGRARHQISAEREVLTEGDMVFIRPSDAHALQGMGEETHLVNVAFPAPLIDAVAKRHDLEGRFFWSATTEPVKVHRDIRQLAELSRAALRLENSVRSALAAEAFLLPILDNLQGRSVPVSPTVPVWLAEACAAAHEPPVFRDGSAGLVRVADRAHAHVSRMMQRYFNETPSDYVNRIRMEHAAVALTGTSDPIAEIAAECGLPNLSHFHRLFRGQHGVPPAEYRRKFQKNVIQPI